MNPVNPCTVEQQIEALRLKRLEVAGHNRALARLDLERKKLQVTLAREYRQLTDEVSGKTYTQTAADDAARTDSRYGVIIDVIGNEAHERDEAMAEAEALRLGVELDIALLRQAVAA